MRIIKLQSENVKKLRAVEITPNGNLIVIGGNNAQGKTSVLDSITMALAGKGSIPAQPIREGADKGRVVCELDDLTVTRTFTSAGGGTLTVASKDGARYPSPQAMLDKLVGKLTFDPLAFSRMAPKDQATTLKGLVGLDYAAQDQERKRLYDLRTIVNREGVELKARVEAMPVHPDAPEQEVSVSELVQELQARRQAQHTRFQADEAFKAELRKAQSIQNEIEQLQTQLRVKEGHLLRQAEVVEAAKQHLDQLPSPDPVEEVEQRISQAEELNRKVRENIQKRELQVILEGKREESKKLSEAIQAIDQGKAEALAATAFPVPGLGFSETGVTFQGLPLEQASGAEQLRISAAIGLAMNPQLRVLLIRDGSLLDETGLGLLRDLAQEHDAQIWLERVGKGAECSVIIEDGQLANMPQIGGDFS